jgi:hypothetical protein
MIILRLLLNILLMCKIINLAILSFFMPTHLKFVLSKIKIEIGIKLQNYNMYENWKAKMFDFEIETNFAKIIK